MKDFPLIVDLDGTLLQTDLLHESTVGMLREQPLKIFYIPVWLFKGKALLKQKLATNTSFDPALLPYNQSLLSWLKQQYANGRTLILCTASDYRFAEAVAKYLGIFADVIASNGTINLAGTKKAAALEQRFGLQGFDYVGNSHADLSVWQCARHAIVVNASKWLREKAKQVCKIEKIFPPVASKFTTWLKILRVHQWLKNALLFVPLIAAHQINNLHLWLVLFLAFIAFSLCASAVYAANDLMDLNHDRQHPRKCRRPFAAGTAPIWIGILIVPLLLFISFCLAIFVGESFLFWLAFYFLLTCLYSWKLKRLVLIDCLTLAVLYTLRIIAGAAAIGMTLSFWLLAFSGFLFLSLAFIKRYAELQTQQLPGKQKLHGRGYITSDASLVQMLGVVSAYASVIVLALYLNSDAVRQLYRSPEFIWGAVPVMLFWNSWMWLRAHRGEMHDDPLVFAIKDKISLFTGIIFASVFFLGTIEWSHL